MVFNRSSNEFCLSFDYIRDNRVLNLRRNSLLIKRGGGLVALRRFGYTEMVYDLSDPYHGTIVPWS